MIDIDGTIELVGTRKTKYKKNNNFCCAASISFCLGFLFFCRFFVSASHQTLCLFGFSALDVAAVVLEREKK